MGEQMLKEIDAYWTNRAEGYSKVNQEELLGVQRRNWSREISRRLLAAFPGRRREDIHILDVGTGPGFFAIILAEAGYQVTAVDYTYEMLLQARRNAGELVDRISFWQMDAQHLKFADETFDAVISRNLTWVLESPEKAYGEWCRVLKKDGLLMNFDANWYGYLFNEEMKKAYEQDRINVEQQQMDDHYTCTDIDAMEAIAVKVPLSRMQRPGWDEAVFKKLGMTAVETDRNIWEQVWSPVEKMNYASTPMFMVTAKKPEGRRQQDA